MAVLEDRAAAALPKDRLTFSSPTGEGRGEGNSASTNQHSHEILAAGSLSVLFLGTVPRPNPSLRDGLSPFFKVEPPRFALLTAEYALEKILM